MSYEIFLYKGVLIPLRDFIFFIFIIVYIVKFTIIIVIVIIIIIDSWTACTAEQRTFSLNVVVKDNSPLMSTGC